MPITIVPAYRVVTKFAREVRDLPQDEGLDALQKDLRRYVLHLLSSVHSSIVDLGSRAAVSQLGDPELDRLLEALQELEEAKVGDVVGVALHRCAEALPRPDMQARVLLLPGDGQSRVMVQRMNGVVGMSLGSQAMLLFLWPTEHLAKWLAYTVGHEYTHLVRNHLFPRGLIDGRMVYLKSQEPENLLDAMVVEGIADAFAMELNPEMAPAWTRALTPEEEAASWPKLRRRLSIIDPMEIRRMLMGDSDRIPQWAGHTIGYRIVEGYLRSHPRSKPATLVGLTARSIFEASGYGQNQEGQSQ